MYRYGQKMWARCCVIPRLDRQASSRNHGHYFWTIPVDRETPTRQRRRGMRPQSGSRQRHFYWQRTTWSPAVVGFESSNPIFSPQPTPTWPVTLCLTITIHIKLVLSCRVGPTSKLRSARDEKSKMGPLTNIVTQKLIILAINKHWISVSNVKLSEDSQFWVRIMFQANYST